MIAWQTNASFQQDRYDYAKNYHSSDLHGKYGTDGGVIPSNYWKSPLYGPKYMISSPTLHPGILEYRWCLIVEGTTGSLTIVSSSLTEGSLEVKLPTIWTDEKQSREEAERRERLEERRVEEKESEEGRCRCAKR